MKTAIGRMKPVLWLAAFAACTALPAAGTTYGDNANWISAGVVNGAANAFGGAWQTGASVSVDTDSEPDRLEITDSTFAANSASQGDVVVFSFKNVCFRDVNPDTPDSTPQVAVKIDDDGNDGYTFKVWDSTASGFRAVSASGITLNDETIDDQYDVEVTITYSANPTYSVKVGNASLGYTSGNETVTTFGLGGTSPVAAQYVAFDGKGSIESMVGSYAYSYAAKSANGTTYGTVAAAIAAYEAGTATLPITVYDTSYTAPTGWSLENGSLTCTAAAYASSSPRIYYTTLQAAIDAQAKATSAVTEQNPLVSVVLLKANAEAITLANTYSVAIDATSGAFEYRGPACTSGDYKIYSAVSGTVATWAARDWETYTVTLAGDTANVTVAGLPASVSEKNCATPVVFTVVANSGYTLSSVKVGDTDVAQTANANEYTLTVSANTTITIATEAESTGITVPVSGGTSGGTSGGGTILVAVPAGSGITAATLVDTSNRAADDQIKVYNTSTGRYYSWVLANVNESLVWEPVPVVASTSSYESPAADTVALSAGQAVWVTVGDASKAVKLNGSYATSDKVPVAVSAGFNLVAPPPRSAEAFISLNSGVGAPAANSDKIIIPTGGAPKNCSWDGSTWYTVEIYVPEGASRPSQRRVENITIPAGTGFWYKSAGAATIEL